MSEKIAGLISNESEPRTDAEDSVELTATEDGQFKQKYLITLGDAGWFGISTLLMPGVTLAVIANCIHEKKSLTCVVSSEYKPRDINGAKKYFGWVGGGSGAVVALASFAFYGASLTSGLITGATAAVVVPLVLANAGGFIAAAIIGAQGPVKGARAKVTKIINTPLNSRQVANQNGGLKKLQGPK